MTTQEQYEVIQAWGDLAIAGRHAQIDRLLAEIDRTLPHDWARDFAAEQEATSKGFCFPRSRCYLRKTADRAARLWLNRVSDQRVQGGYWESADQARLLPDSAEAILDFRRRILEPAANAAQLTISHDDLGTLGLVPGGVKASLWAFYDSSNFEWPPSGESLRRWREFVIAAYSDHAAFDPDELTNWLTEKGWSVANAKALVSQLTADASLLSDYEDLRQPA